MKTLHNGPQPIGAVLALFALLAPSLAGSPSAQSVTPAFPTPTGHVNDFADLLDEGARDDLEELLVKLEEDTTAEIAIATVTSLNGSSIEDYATGLFNTWGIGQAGKDNGVLVLVVPESREMRIEVGYGLEAIVPDGLAGALIRADFIPKFRDGDYQQGIITGVRRLSEIVRRNRPPTPDEIRAIERPGQPPVIELPGWVFLPVLGLFVGGGAYMIGVGGGARIVGMALFGLIVAAFGVVLSWFYSPMAALGQAALGTGVAWLGIRRGRTPAFRASARGSTKGNKWIMGTSGRSSSRGSSGSSSGSSGSTFGGGRSGGGGATGRW